MTRTRWAKINKASLEPNGTPRLEVLAYDNEGMEFWQNMTQEDGIELADDIYAACGIKREE